MIIALLKNLKSCDQPRDAHIRLGLLTFLHGEREEVKKSYISPKIYRQLVV